MIGFLILIGMGWAYVFAGYCPTNPMVGVACTVAFLELAIEVAILGWRAGRKQCSDG